MEETKCFTLKEVKEEIEKGNVEKYWSDSSHSPHINAYKEPLLTIDQALAEDWQIKYKEDKPMNAAKYRSERWNQKLHAEPSLETILQRWNFEDVESAFDEGLKEGKKQERKRFDPLVDELKKHGQRGNYKYILSLIKEDKP